MDNISHPTFEVPFEYSKTQESQKEKNFVASNRKSKLWQNACLKWKAIK